MLDWCLITTNVCSNGAIITTNMKYIATFDWCYNNNKDIAMLDWCYNRNKYIAMKPLKLTLIKY